MAYGLLGRKLGHSWSPAIHAELGSTPYTLHELEPEELCAFLETTSLSALNVTIPYKKDVLPYCTVLSDAAKKMGCINTMVKKADGWHGDNTDYYGFTYMVKQAGMDPKGKKCLVLGSGGASLTVVQVLQDMGAASVVVISRSGKDNYDNLSLHADAELIVNATPVGMYPNNGVSPVDLTVFPECKAVLDLIYNPRRTALLIAAEKLGIPCCSGLTMLVAQAKRAAELFMDCTLPDTLIPRIVEKLQRQMENIVLIGMPGCGKTTIANALGKELGMDVVDADAEIEAMAGKTIPQIFAEGGEDAFRQLETCVLDNLGKRSGIIISTGGGCVTRKENYPHLHQNGKIIWLTRELEALPTEGRPLSQTNDLADMYCVRRPMYQYFADMTVDNTGTVESTVSAIKEALL